MDYDLEEKVLFFIAEKLNITIDQAYDLLLVRLLMTLSAKLSGRPTRLPR